MPKREDRLLLEDIYEAGKKIIGFTKGMSFNEFIADVRTTDAVLRNFEVIGEASGLVSNTLK